jgi:signal transduction histidine kinase
MFIKRFIQKVATIGVHDELSYGRKLKTVVLNHLNFFALLICTIRFGYIFSGVDMEYNATVKLLNFLPLVFFLVQMLLIARGYYKVVLYSALIVIPPLIVGLNYFTLDAGQEVFLIIPAVLSFYFLNEYRSIVLMFLYDMLWVLLYYINKNSANVAEFPADTGLEIINFTGSLVILFLLLYSVKYQVRSYERYILKINDRLSSVNKVKDKIFTIISHDLRTPLVSVSHLMSYLLRDDADLPAVKSMLPEISSEINNTSNLMNNLLQWSKSQLQEIKATPNNIVLRELAGEVADQLKPMYSAKQIKVCNQVEPDALAWADSGMIAIVLRNLLSNALKFSDEDSYVKVYSKIQEGKVRIGIRDYGTGIKEELKPFIFHSFDHTSRGTANEQGFGLGLLICKELVEANKGTIHFSSTQGDGSDFWMELPAEKNVAIKEQTIKTQANTKLTGEALRLSAF